MTLADNIAADNILVAFLAGSENVPVAEWGSSCFVFFVAVFLGYSQYWPGGFMVLWFLSQGTPEGSTGSLRRRGHGLKSHPSLKSHPTNWEKPGIEPATPGLQDIGSSPTPQRLLMRFWLVVFCKQLKMEIKYPSSFSV